MLEFWVIEYLAERPSCFIADESGWITFSFSKAKRFETRAAADTALRRLKLTWDWKAVGHSIAKTQ